MALSVLAFLFLLTVAAAFIDYYVWHQHQGFSEGWDVYMFTDTCYGLVIYSLLLVMFLVGCCGGCWVRQVRSAEIAEAARACAAAETYELARVNQRAVAEAFAHSSVGRVALV